MEKCGPVPCVNQIVRPPRPWASEALGWGDCLTCTADAGNARCPGFHEVPDPEATPTAVGDGRADEDRGDG